MFSRGKELGNTVRVGLVISKNSLVVVPWHTWFYNAVPSERAERFPQFYSIPLDSRFEQNHVLTLPCSHPNFSSPIGQVNLYQGSYLVPIPLPPSPSAVFFSISTFITYFYYLVFNTALPAHPGSWCLGDCPSPCSRSEAA